MGDALGSCHPSLIISHARTTAAYGRPAASPAACKARPSCRLRRLRPSPCGGSVLPGRRVMRQPLRHLQAHDPRDRSAAYRLQASMPSAWSSRKALTLPPHATAPPRSTASCPLRRLDLCLRTLLPPYRPMGYISSRLSLMVRTSSRRVCRATAPSILVLKLRSAPLACCFSVAARRVRPLLACPPTRLLRPHQAIASPANRRIRLRPHARAVPASMLARLMRRATLPAPWFTTITGTGANIPTHRPQKR